MSRYEDILTIVKDPETFSNAKVQESLQELELEAAQRLKEGVRVTPTTSNADPPKHRRTRKHAQKAFSAKRVQELEPRVCEIAEGLIDGFVDEYKHRPKDQKPFGERTDNRTIVTADFLGLVERGVSPA